MAVYPVDYVYNRGRTVKGLELLVYMSINQEEMQECTNDNFNQ